MRAISPQTRMNIGFLPVCFPFPQTCVQRMAGEGYEQENPGGKTLKGHEWEACHKQARV